MKSLFSERMAGEWKRDRQRTFHKVDHSIHKPAAEALDYSALETGAVRCGKGSIKLFDEYGFERHGPDSANVRDGLRESVSQSRRQRYDNSG